MDGFAIEKEWIFALDIGTRNVVGVLGYEEEGCLHIAHTVLIEHKTRAMLDGQIHHIGKVTEVIKQVKAQLENSCQIELKEVAIAAAGRVLKTKVSEASMELKEEKRIAEFHVHALELQGVENAKQMLHDEIGNALDYYCVAYSPIKYCLDGYEIENLLGHKGKKIQGTVISTFLPRQVIDSLYSAVEGAGLMVSHLTLEPIAAINISIPQDIRMLNLALLDIGAGTSDIAITKSGSITAYGMLPSAGDEFSERLVEEYLVSFETAEKIKKNLAQEKEVQFTDILGLNQSVIFKEVLDKLEEQLDKLTGDIAGKIRELNGNKPPKAVFCVGGGSQFPGLTKYLCQKLEIPEERVVVQEVPNLSKMDFSLDVELKGPEFMTPIGICMTSWINKKSSFIQVTLNGTKVQLLNTKTLTVMDAAIKGNYHSVNLIQKNGRDLEFTLNGESIKIYGELGSPAEILINKKEASLISQINNDDEIRLSTARAGKDASLTMAQLKSRFKDKKLYFGGKPIDVKTQISVNEKILMEDEKISTGDMVMTRGADNLEELLNYLNIKPMDFIFYVNGRMAHLKTKLNEEDSIELMTKKSSEVAITESKERTPDFVVYVNDKPIKMSGKDSYLFLHILNYIDIPVNSGKGNIILKCNGNKAAYTDPLNPQDKIEIYWEK